MKQEAYQESEAQRQRSSQKNRANTGRSNEDAQNDEVRNRLAKKSSRRRVKYEVKGNELNDNDEAEPDQSGIEMEGSMQKPLAAVTPSRKTGSVVPDISADAAGAAAAFLLSHSNPIGAQEQGDDDDASSSEARNKDETNSDEDAKDGEDENVDEDTVCALASEIKKAVTFDNSTEGTTNAAIPSTDKGESGRKRRTGLGDALLEPKGSGSIGAAPEGGAKINFLSNLTNVKEKSLVRTTGLDPTKKGKNPTEVAMMLKKQGSTQQLFELAQGWHALQTRARNAFKMMCVRPALSSSRS